MKVAEKLRSLKTWMMDKKIPRGQQTKAMMYFSKMYKSRLVYDESEIIQVL